MYIAITFTKQHGKYCQNHNWFGAVESGRYKYDTLIRNMDHCSSDENCLSFYQIGCSGTKFINCMKDGYGKADDSKYNVVTSSSGSCLYVKGKRIVGFFYLLILYKEYKKFVQVFINLNTDFKNRNFR